MPRNRYSTGAVEELPKASPVVGLIKEIHQELRKHEGQLFEYRGETYQVDAWYVFSIPMQPGYMTVLVSDLVKEVYGQGRAAWQDFSKAILSMPLTLEDPVMKFRGYVQLCKDEGKPLREDTRRWMEKMFNRMAENDPPEETEDDS